MKKYLKWWKNLSEKTKWNLTINYRTHWTELTNEQILEIYNSEHGN